MYQSITNLPSSIRDALPRKAQELYRAAFNRNLQLMSVAEKPEESESKHAEAAHRAARLAVEAQFTRDEQGKWHERPIGESMKRQHNVPGTGEADKQP